MGKRIVPGRRTLALRIILRELGNLGISTTSVKADAAVTLLAKAKGLVGHFDRISLAEVINPKFVKSRDSVPLEDKPRVLKEFNNPVRVGKLSRHLLIAPNTQKAKGLANRKSVPAENKIRDFYECWEWKRLRYDFLKEKDRRCQCCGTSADDGVRIVVDHIKPIRFFWDLRLEKSNLQILCDDCNMGKGSRDQTDWRNIIPIPLRREH